MRTARIPGLFGIERIARHTAEPTPEDRFLAMANKAVPSSVENASISKPNDDFAATAKAFLKSSCEFVDGHLERYLPSEKTSPETLHNAMRYSVFAGGKPLRPALVLAAC